MPQSYSCWRYQYRLKAVAAPLPFGKQNSAAQIFNAAVEIAPVSMRGFHIIMPIAQGLPKRNELRVQPDRRRQAVWAVPRARSAARQRCTRARARGGQAISASRQQNSERHVQPVGHFLKPLRGFALALMALRARNAPPWLLANFRGFEPPEHVPRTSARAHTCAVVFGRTPCVPWSRWYEKRPAAGGEKNGDV